MASGPHAVQVHHGPVQACGRVTRAVRCAGLLRRTVYCNCRVAIKIASHAPTVPRIGIKNHDKNLTDPRLTLSTIKHHRDVPRLKCCVHGCVRYACGLWPAAPRCAPNAHTLYRKSPAYNSTHIPYGPQSHLLMPVGGGCPPCHSDAKDSCHLALDSCCLGSAQRPRGVLRGRRPQSSGAASVRHVQGSPSIAVGESTTAP